MKSINIIACVIMAATVAACAPSGYYDSNGEYRSYGKSDSFRHDKAMSAVPDTDVPASRTVIVYDRAGYYDWQGAYVEHPTVSHVPSYMTPPAGMCRVWFPDRSVRYQPDVESCVGIRTRVPEGAYVIYGG